MALLGDKNWYLPRWLHWLPDVRVEGRPVEAGNANGKPAQPQGVEGAVAD
jgi:RND superfamily putative drug exporter